MTKYQTIARYTESGLGYAVWAPGEDRAEFWFGTLKEVFEFAAACGWGKIRHIV